MAKKTIFIGSASESKELAASIAQALAEKGYRPLRWWHEFPPGSITLDRLLEIARTVDGATFLCTAVDKTWYRQELSASPRDNVLLEYGIFVAHLGRHRTLLLKDPHARLPSDIAAITYERILEDTATVAERTVQHFNAQFIDSLPPPLEAISIVADPVVVEQMTREFLPYSWHVRTLYFGIEGAKAWLSAVKDPAYTSKDHARRLRRIVLKAVDLVDARTFVSLGPGDAETDKEIAIRLRNKEPWLQYIPVDISDGLLQRAASILSGQVRVPVGILGDFEDRLNFINRQIRVYGTSPSLIALLGNTMGNLDHYERNFLSTIGAMLGEVDSLLLEVSLAHPKWSRDKDRRAMHTGYTRGMRQFIATGVSRRTGESVESIVAEFETRVRFEEGVSDVPGTRTIDLVDDKSGLLIASVRRYVWESLLDWLKSEMGFKIGFEEAIYIDESVGDGVILVKRR